MKWIEMSKKCESCGEIYYRKRGEYASNFRRNKTCSKTCRYLRAKGMNNARWVGGITNDGSGYLRINQTKQRLHRHIMEQHLGRKLNSNEEVHHIDEDKYNNDINNLKVMTKAEHTSVTFKGKKRSDNWRVKRGLKPLKEALV